MFECEVWHKLSSSPKTTFRSRVKTGAETGTQTLIEAIDAVVSLSIVQLSSGLRPPPAERERQHRIPEEASIESR